MANLVVELGTLLVNMYICVEDYGLALLANILVWKKTLLASTYLTRWLVSADMESGCYLPRYPCVYRILNPIG